MCNLPRIPALVMLASWVSLVGAEPPDLNPPGGESTALTVPAVSKSGADSAVRAEPPIPREQELVSVLKRRVPENKPLRLGDAPEWFQSMMLQIVRENVPDRYVNEKKWGKTAPRWDGLKVRRDGLKIRTKRRWKEVNHGTWKRYEVQIVDPQENLWMRIQNVREVADGKLAFQVDIQSRIWAEGRVAKWTKGVRVGSISAEADADVHMHIWCQVGTRLDFQKLPPDIIVVPEVTQADLELTRFELHRISKLDGPLVEQLGRGLKKIVIDKIDEKKQDLPRKINRQISKQEDKLRFSLHDFATTKWKSLVSKQAGQRDVAASE